MVDSDQWAHRLLIVQDDIDHDDPPHEIIRGLTDFFTTAGRLVENYSTQQINDGLWFLSSPRCDLLYTLYDEQVDVALRLGCVEAIRAMYENLFAPHCRRIMSNGVETPPEEPLNSICYMWWDNFPSWGRPEEPYHRRIDSALLAVMRDNLAGKNIACVESGLHGLGHWHHNYPDQVETTIDDFLRTHRRLTPPLREYALAARGGHVL
ncbi:hypothetical protein [Sphaerisporangium aureirubrum]|uniref:Uncharacterized protein n=1 Tax=Sphaerisporangium aureirubrum TaxID=1544736 RepID=A0ABW1NA25_9ACTN